MTHRHTTPPRAHVLKAPVSGDISAYAERELRERAQRERAQTVAVLAVQMLTQRGALCRAPLWGAGLSQRTPSASKLKAHLIKYLVGFTRSVVV